VQRYLLRRVLTLIPTLLGVSLVVFALIRLIPGDPAKVMLGEFAPPERVVEIRHDLGLDRPLALQFAIWVRNLTMADLGRSILTQQPVVQEIWTRFPATFELTAFATIFAILVGIGLGILSANAHNKRLDVGASIVSVLGMPIPIFWFGLMLLYIFGVWFRVLPISGRLTIGVPLHRITGLVLVDGVLQLNSAALLDGLRHMVLPAFSLSVIPLAIISRMTRAAMLEVLRQEYITVAWAKGLSHRAVLARHALKNALIPVATVIGTRFGSQLAGAVLVEVVYGWPGIGRLVFDAIQRRDYPVIQGVILFIAVMFAFINLLTDLAYAVLDPRVRYE
jgi:peptide/nickel transport system permease protein